MAILKVIEIMASSKSTWEDAASNAVKEASRTVKGIRSIYIKEQSATVKKEKSRNTELSLKFLSP